MKLARLLLRVTIGGLFIGHGTQKLFGWFGGHGPDATGQFFEQLGLRPGRRNAIAAGAAEAGGGLGIALGLATPLSAAALIGTMITAIRTVHLSKGPWVSEGGYEYNLVLILALLALVETGPGPLAVDDGESGGLARMLLALGLGVGGSVAIQQVAAGAPGPEQAPDEAVEAARGSGD